MGRRRAHHRCMLAWSRELASRPRSSRRNRRGRRAPRSGENPHATQSDGSVLLDHEVRCLDVARIRPRRTRRAACVGDRWHRLLHRSSASRSAAMARTCGCVALVQGTVSIAGRIAPARLPGRPHHSQCAHRIWPRRCWRHSLPLGLRFEPAPGKDTPRSGSGCLCGFRRVHGASRSGLTAATIKKRGRVAQLDRAPAF